MSGLPPDIVSADMATFVDPAANSNLENFARATEQREKQMKRDAKAMGVNAKKLEETVKFAEATKIPEDDTDAKAKILRKINGYQREFPERLVHCKVPKTFGAKATLEELKIHLADIEHELGKTGGLEVAKRGFVVVCGLIEQMQERTKILPYNLQHYSKIAEQSLQDRLMPDGKVSEAPMIPLLKEFMVKYDDWFSTRVEARFILEMVGLMAICHKMNTDATVQQRMAAATTQTAQAETAKAARKL